MSLTTDSLPVTITAASLLVLLLISSLPAPALFGRKAGKALTRVGTDEGTRELEHCSPLSNSVQQGVHSHSIHTAFTQHSNSKQMTFVDSKTQLVKNMLRNEQTRMR